jgi:uncharacterized membrane protein YdbT with pleckstrin-like domain
MELHAGETAYFSGHPSWRGMFAFHLTGVLGSIVVGAVVAVVGSAPIGIAIAVAGSLITILIGIIRRWATTYTITDERLIIERGIVAKHMQQTRIDRVQNVNTNQSVFERMLKVGVVDFDTAGSGDSDFSFIGVANPGEIVTVVDRAQRAAGAEARERQGGVGGL